MTTVYTALVTRGKETWTASTQDLPNGKIVLAMGKTWKQLRKIAGEGCDQTLGVPDGDTVVDLKFEDAELQALVDETKRLTTIAREARFEADVALGKAARRLTQEASVRDVAEILGYSHQYIARLAPRSE